METTNMYISADLIVRIFCNARLNPYRRIVFYFLFFLFLILLLGIYIFYNACGKTTRKLGLVMFHRRS